MLCIPLSSCSGNSRRGPELTPFQHGKIVAASDFGANPTAIAKCYKHPRSTIRSTLSLDSVRNEGISQARTGRPLTYSDREERKIIRQVRLYPKCTYKEVCAACAVQLCDSTLRSILAKHGIANWRAKKRLYLTEEHAATRLAWCLVQKDWTIEE
jgi:hypothetical protein